MKVLGIENRSENWKTARHFSPLLGAGSVRLAKRLGDRSEPQEDEVHLELFWKGMRDYLHGRGEKTGDEDFAGRYTSLFPDLRNCIQDSQLFRALNDLNYDVSTKDHEAKLGNNLVNTEIDVVLETARYIFVGEAKHEMSFHANGTLVLVHQLIRQYVMARILMNILESCGNAEKEVIPFIVGDDISELKKKSQVKFMLRQKWLKQKNILSWNDIQEFHP